MCATRVHRRATIVVIVIALLFAAHAAWPAGAGDARPKPEQLFATDAALTLTLTAPWQEFERNKNARKPYAGTLEYVDESGAKHVVPAAFQARGINRLKVCELPPIRLIFDKRAVEGTPFRGNNSLKLTHHCGSGERWEQYTIKEMLAYRIYNLVTQRSFRVRPVSVTYVDSAGHAPDGPHFGFLLENDSAMARRNDLAKLEVPRLTLDKLEPLQASRFALFEYLIGNTDFDQLSGPAASRCCHNDVLIGADARSQVYAVPYDFDSSGLVDASYAVPSPILHINSNRERVFRGFCADNATLETARGDMLRLEPQILELVRTDSRLTERSRQAAGDYLAQGFGILRDDGKFAREITARCRK